MLRHACGVGVVILVLGIVLTGELAWAKQPAPGPAWALQRLAEKQGHPGAAAQTLRSFAHQVSPQIEAAAAGITPQALRRAIEQGGSLVSRLETAQGKKLSADQTRRIGEAQRDHARRLEPLRTKLVQEVAAAAGLPEAKVRKILARDQGGAATEKRTLAQLEKSLGRQLTAGDARRVTAARDEFRTASQAQRNALARELGKIAGVPQSVVLELMP